MARAVDLVHVVHRNERVVNVEWKGERLWRWSMGGGGGGGAGGCGSAMSLHGGVGG